MRSLLSGHPNRTYDAASTAAGSGQLSDTGTAGAPRLAPASTIVHPGQARGYDQTIERRWTFAQGVTSEASISKNARWPPLLKLYTVIAGPLYKLSPFPLNLDVDPFFSSLPSRVPFFF